MVDDHRFAGPVPPEGGAKRDAGGEIVNAAAIRIWAEPGAAPGAGCMIRFSEFIAA